MTTPVWALKEWAIAVSALLAGDLVMLIRKGGIREAKSHFEVPSTRALLFPTYEHQQASQMRPPFAAQVRTQTVPQIGDTIVLPGWVEVTHQLRLTRTDVVERLHPFHIWTDAWLEERLRWQPDRPTDILLLRAYQISTPLTLTYQKHHKGCRSWITLDGIESWPAGTPVLSADRYATMTATIQAAIALATSTVASLG